MKFSNIPQEGWFIMAGRRVVKHHSLKGRGKSLVWILGKHLIQVLYELENSVPLKTLTLK